MAYALLKLRELAPQFERHRAVCVVGLLGLDRTASPLLFLFGLTAEGVVVVIQAFAVPFEPDVHSGQKRGCQGLDTSLGCSGRYVVAGGAVRFTRVGRELPQPERVGEFDFDGRWRR